MDVESQLLAMFTTPDPDLELENLPPANDALPEEYAPTDPNKTEETISEYREGQMTIARMMARASQHIREMGLSRPRGVHPAILRAQMRAQQFPRDRRFARNPDCPNLRPLPKPGRD